MSKKAGKSQDGGRRGTGSTSTETQQTTIDSHFSEERGLEETLSKIEKRLGSLASQDYIDQRFKEMVTEKIFRQTHKELKEEIMCEIEILKQTVTTLRNDMSDMDTSLKAVERDNERLRKENENVKRQLEQREFVLRKMEMEVNESEQYSRRNNVRIYGVEDRNAGESSEQTTEKVLALLNDKLRMSLKKADIDIAHRIGRFHTDGDRPIICRFVSRVNTIQTMKLKRSLKGSSVVIREDLTQRNVALLKKTSAMPQVKTVWTDQGRIFALLQNGRKVAVTHSTDMSSL